MPFPVPASSSTAVTFGTLTDLEVRLGRTLSGADADRAQAALVDAAAAVFACVRRVPDPAPAVVTSVALAVALRRFHNPVGLVSETVGSYSYRAADDVGALLTKTECALLRRACRVSDSGIGSMQMVSPYRDAEDA